MARRICQPFAFHLSPGASHFLGRQNLLKPMHDVARYSFTPSLLPLTLTHKVVL
jgi:hypothetical protein